MKKFYNYLRGTRTSLLTTFFVILGIFFFIFFSLGDKFPLFSKIESYELNVNGLILIIIFYILITIISIYKDKKNQEIKILQTKSDDQQKQLDSETKQLWKKFNDMVFYKDREAIRDSMKVFVRSNPFISGVQLYNYSLKHKLLIKFGRRFRSVDLKVNHKESFAAETEDLNAVIQMYESIPLSLYRSYLKVIESKNPGDVARFIKKYTGVLQKKYKTNNKISNEHLIVFCVVVLATQYLFEILLKDEEDLKEFRLRNIGVSGINNSEFYNYKRTGLLRSILNDEASNKFPYEESSVNEEDNSKQYYIFRNRRFQNDDFFTGAKDGRIYLSRTFMFQNSPHLLLLIIHPEILKERNGYKQLFELEKNFSSLLEQNEITLGYNKGRGEFQ